MNGSPGLRRTTVNDLAVPFALVGGAVYVLLRFSYGSLPPLKVLIAAPLAALAAAEFVAARRVRAAVRHDPNAKVMAAIVIARCVALGKASSLVGAGVAGAAAALLIRLVPDLGQVDVAGHDAIVAAFVLGSSGLIVGAGLLLERAGVDPGNDDPPRPRA